MSDKEKALELAIDALVKNPNFPKECWCGCGLEEPERSQVWQRANEIAEKEREEHFWYQDL